MSPYACIAVSVEVQDQVHQLRGQAPSPHSTLWLTRSGLAEVHKCSMHGRLILPGKLHHAP